MNYDEMPGVRWSYLKNYAHGAHFARWRAENPPSGPSINLGRRVHQALLEPDKWQPVIYLGGRRYGAEWEKFRAKHADADICTTAEVEQVTAIEEAVRSHPIAERLLDSGIYECPVTGVIDEVRLKGKIDAIAANNTIVDIKTTYGGVDPRSVQRICLSHGWHGQLALYRELAMRSVEVSGCSVIVVSTTAPHEVAVYRLSEQTLALGMSLVKRCLSLFRHCEELRIWPKRWISREIPLDLPDYETEDLSEVLC